MTPEDKTFLTLGLSCFALGVTIATLAFKLVGGC